MDQYIGKMLDNRYEILDIIGVGGMAVVYKAYCHRLNRFVAIKILKRDMAADEEFRRRFHDEAQAVAMLSHSNIVSVYDVSRGEDLDYIVMELIDGITLKQYMQKKNGSLNWREALYLTTQIIRALGHAHSRGIIHRDIKPQNIMVLRDGSVKVADFGIARVMSSAKTTMTQEALGSVHYISPEQARGSHIDARADIYSAGVVLYEMLTGRLPFDGDSPVSVAIQHINATPLSPRELNPEIPPGLEEITMKAMASRIDQRYVNVEAMLRDLEDFRKNPQIIFHYNLAAFHGNQPIPEDAGHLDDGGDTLGRRQRPPVRTRSGPPPRRYPEEPEEYEEPESHHKMVVPIVIIVFLLGAALVIWLAFFSGLFNKPEEVQVPSLLDRELSDVYGDLSIMEQFDVRLKSTETSEDYEEGHIMRQDPAPGDFAEVGSTIWVVVSGGEEPVSMISVEGYTYEDAIRVLQELGLTVAAPQEQYHDDVEAGKVISQTPPKGTQLYPGDEVQLVVSKGQESKPVMVPTLTGQSIDQARQMLTELGLKVGSVQEVSSNEPKGEVVYQSIAPNTEVEEGTAITLHYSKGPAPNPPAEDPTPEVPPTEDPQPITSKPITVTLPAEPASVTVRITVGGQEAYNQSVDTSVGTVTVPVSGSGSQEVCVYIDNALTDTQTVDFSS